jgi:osmotically-inducible protein OsmY
VCSSDLALIEATFGHEFVTSLSVSVVAPRKIQVRGTVGTEARRAEAEQVLRAVKGVDAVENLIEVAQVIPIQTV